MAIYHCSCKMISRSTGRSSVGASAYRSGEKLVNERDGIIHDYTHKTGIEYSEVMLPDNAPEEWEDRNTLWNQVEKIEKANDGQLAREFEIALPKELTLEQQIETVQNICNIYFVSEGMCVDFAIHDKKDGNPHTHIMTTLRTIDENGKWENKREKLYLCKNVSGEERAFTSIELSSPENSEWKKQYYYSRNGNPKGKKVFLSEYEKHNNPKYSDYERIKGEKNPKSEKYGRLHPTLERWYSNDFLLGVRQGISEETNSILAKYGHEERIEHRSYSELGIEQFPQIHIGVAATQMERKGILTELGDINRHIKEVNRRIKELSGQLLQEKIKYFKVHTDIQIQNVHNAMQLKMSDIKNISSLKYLEKIDHQISVLESRLQKISDKGIMKNEYVLVSDKQKIPYMTYQLEKFNQAKNEIQEMSAERKQDLMDKINNNLKEYKSMNQEKTEVPNTSVQKSNASAPDLHAAAHKLESLRNEFISVKSEVLESEKVQNRPRVTREYEVNINIIKHCVQEYNSKKEILENAKAEKQSLGLFKGTEKQRLDKDVTWAESSLKYQLEKLNTLGVKDISKADTIIKDLEQKDRIEKNTVNIFNQTIGKMNERTEQIRNEYANIKGSLSPEEQKEVSSIQESIRNSNPDQNCEFKSLSRMQAEVKANDLEPQAQLVQERERVRTIPRTR